MVRRIGAKMIVALSSPSWTDAGAVTISFPTSKPKSVSPSFVKAQPLIQTLTGAVGDSSVIKTCPYRKTVFVIQPNCSATHCIIKHSAI